MAELAACLVKDKLTSLLCEDLELLRGGHEEVEDIKVELDFITCFLKEADARAARDQDSDSIITWVKLVRETAFRIEDALDDYILHLHVVNSHEHHGFIKAHLCKLACFLKSMKKRHEIASELRDIVRSVRGIGQKRKRYGLKITETNGSSSTDVARRDPRVGLQFVQDDELVGIDSSRNELVRRLVEELLRTLLRRFYEARKESPPDAISRMHEEELISKSREYLQDKRYVAVFDDVWNQDFWHSIEHVLLDNNKGCRIIITTRNAKVAEFCKKSSLIYVHGLKPLPLELAQELLYRTAFRFDPGKQCPPELKDLSLDITSVRNLESFKGKARHLSLYDRPNNFPGSSSKSQAHSIIAFEAADVPESLL
ncbi:hypothetical protein V6N13_051665 [Hibiscus sabdariffa]